MWKFLSVLVVLVSLCGLAVSQVCPYYTSCTACVVAEDYNNNACLWCPSTSSCISSSNQTDTQCSIGIAEATCPCEQYTSCINCITELECGWCNDGSGYCANGTLNAPFSGSCSNWNGNNNFYACSDVNHLFTFLGLGLTAFVVIIILIAICCCGVIPAIIICIACRSCRRNDGYVVLQTQPHHGHHGHHGGF